MHAALQISLYGQVLMLCTLAIRLFCKEIYEITVLLYCRLFLQPWLQYFCLLFCSWWSSCQWGSMALLWKEFDVECWHHLCTRVRDYVQLVSQQSILLLYLFSFHEPHLWLHSEGALSVMDEAKAPSWRCLRRYGGIQTSGHKKLLEEKCTWRVQNNVRFHTRGKYPLPKVVVIKTPHLDSYLKTELSSMTKSVDKELAKIRTNLYVECTCTSYLDLGGR